MTTSEVSVSACIIICSASYISLSGRNMDQDPLVALELLNKAANSVDRVVECVNKFANWWGNAETMISTLGNQVVSADGRRLSAIRIHMVQKSWEVLQKEYEVYKRSVSELQFPAV